MSKPIIDPLTLSEEQREAIRDRYRILFMLGIYLDFHLITVEDFREIADSLAENLDMVEWLFGKEFFNQKGE